MRDENQPLHIKYRPSTFDEVIGNESTIESLKSILSRDKGEVRSFLITGPSGCGKTTLARIMAWSLDCSDRDFQEYNSANVRGIDTIREIANASIYKPLHGKIKVYLLDEIHKATNDAQNALLKLLEDTPTHVRFILCTTDPEKLLPTIKSRCATFHVSPLQRSKMMKLLKWVCTEEEIEVSKTVLQKVAECADGSPRKALVLLDQVIDIENEELALKAILDSSVDEQSIAELCQELLKTGNKWPVLSKILKGLDKEPESIRYAIINYLSKVLLDKDSDRVAQMLEIFLESWMYSGRGGLVSAVYLANRI
jgi:DNA polymerase-3 subunit gamma/tau